MESPAAPADELERLARLRALKLLDTPAEERFDRITRLASRLFDVPIALVSLVDAERQWFKSKVGLDAAETPRSISFCGHAIHRPDAFVIADTETDPRFADNPLVTSDPKIRFYAGQPLLGESGSAVGTLCLIDRQPRQLDGAQQACLRDLAAIVESELIALDLAQLTKALETAQRRIERLERILPTCAYCRKVRNEDDYWKEVNAYFKDHEGIVFSHGICPACMTEHVEPELRAMEEEKRRRGSD